MELHYIRKDGMGGNGQIGWFLPRNHSYHAPALSASNQTRKAGKSNSAHIVSGEVASTVLDGSLDLEHRTR